MSAACSRSDTVYCFKFAKFEDAVDDHVDLGS